jgi:N6-adenosine-specific RNA methylase IME4
MSGAVSLYDTARQALAAAHSIDEAKTLRDKSEAMRVYARQANDREMEVHASEIRIRAERRIGELIAAQRDGPGLAQGRRSDLMGRSDLGCGPTQVEKPTLAEAGIGKNLADRARKLAALREDEFEQRMADRRDKLERESDRITVDILAAGDKAARRAAREAELGAKIRALPAKKYGLILADPEWRFEVWSRETGMDRAADNHYPTSLIEFIVARDVPSITAENAVLALYATVPMLPQALIVMAAWGFDYRSHVIWAKDRIGTGYWFRNKHELLLIGVRGDVPAPAMGTQWPSVVEAPRTAHSAKPEIFHEMLEAYFPSLPKIELNRRGPPRLGWDAWGNEAEPGDAAAGAAA